MTTSGRFSSSNARTGCAIGVEPHPTSIALTSSVAGTSAALSRSISRVTRFGLGRGRAPGRGVEQAEPLADRRQPPVGVVLAQQQPILGARGEHPVRLAADSARHQVVDHHADIGLVAPQNQRRFAANLKRRVDSRHQTLRARFLVAGRAVDLAGEEQPATSLVSSDGCNCVGSEKSYSIA